MCPIDGATPSTLDPAAVPASDAPPAKISVATLDANGLFLGVAVIDPAAKLPEQIEVPADCDLKPGRYRWVAIDGYAGGGRFEYLAGAVAQPVVIAEPAASFDAALYALAFAAQAGGITLSGPTLAWMDELARAAKTNPI